ncbi:MAG TPA: FecR domain-containing protein [Puia sp.]|nr:FecR domain-containing protein [Puia sp.]
MEERIKYLFRQYLENKFSREELIEFFSYIRASHEDEPLRDMVKKAYDDMQQTHPSHSYVNEYGKIILPEMDADPAAGRKNRLKGRLAPALVMVVCLLLFGAAVWLIHGAGRGEKTSATALLTKKKTERSEYKYLLLPDSTQVWLNASSSLEYPDHFNTGKREVVLSGEAYFDVKHADRSPFIIHTGKISTTVLGTAFNIKAYPDRQNIIVSVSRGKVKVSYDEVLVATLISGQQVKVNSLHNTVEEKKIAPTQVASWQHGDMSYEDEDFEDIIADLERLYNVKIKIDNATVRNLKVSTEFRREIGIEQALEVLCQLTDTNLKQANGWYIIQ